MSTVRQNTGRGSGYTLIELLLYIAILGSLLIAISLYFTTFVEARVKNQSITEVNQQGVLAMEDITQTIRNATSITTPVAAGTGASLTLVVPTSGESPTIFDAPSGAMRIKKGAASTVDLTNSKVTVSAVSFANLTRAGTPGVVRVTFTVSRASNSTKNEYSYQKTFTASAALRKP